MKREEITVGEWYAIRIGIWIESGRVDGFAEGKPIVYIGGYWRPVSLSQILRPTVSPEEHAVQMREMLSRTAPVCVSPIGDIEPLGLNRHPGAFREVIHKQGSVFYEGDY